MTTEIQVALNVYNAIERIISRNSNNYEFSTSDVVIEIEQYALANGDISPKKNWKGSSPNRNYYEVRISGICSKLREAGSIFHKNSLRKWSVNQASFFKNYEATSKKFFDSLEYPECDGYSPNYGDHPLVSIPVYHDICKRFNLI